MDPLAVGTNCYGGMRIGKSTSLLTLWLDSTGAPGTNPPLPLVLTFTVIKGPTFLIQSKPPAALFSDVDKESVQAYQQKVALMAAKCLDTTPASKRKDSMTLTSKWTAAYPKKYCPMK
jgi:hypothetical protein